LLSFLLGNDLPMAFAGSEESMPTQSDLLGADRPESLKPAVRKLLDEARRTGVSYFASPVDWRDEVLYFLLPDRFSDGNEAGRPPLTRAEIQSLRQAASRPGWNWQQWAESGKRWQGGTLNGIRGRLDYLRTLGATAIWIGPVFKQRARVDSYHGYGVQDFLDIDPRFGSRRDLIDLVAAAHQKGMRIILDIIVNHSGDNWGYVPPGQGPSAARNETPYLDWPNHYGNPQDASTSGWQLAWRDEQQAGFTTSGGAIADRHEGAWPRDFQTPAAYTRAGKGDLGAGALSDQHAEHKRTDFFSLKDFALDVSTTLNDLTECFKYWIALTDADGFRIDTVKHMSLEDTRNFCGAMREFADSVGKRNFLLVGEIAGGDFAQDFVLDNLGILRRNLSAALDIGSARPNLQSTAKGLVAPGVYLDGFKEASEGFESHRAFGDRHVSILDDHDHVFGDKVRFSAEIPDDSPVKDFHVVAATAVQLFTLGIPCIYYGTEQAFAGPAQSQIQFLLAEGWNNGGNHGDRFLREAMFGPQHPRAHHSQSLSTQTGGVDTGLPGFGPFGTAGKHCFDTGSPSYVRIEALCAVRRKYGVLRIGRQYAREVRLPFTDFVFPAAGEIIAWSRILDTQEALVVVNPNGADARGGDIVVSAEVSGSGSKFTVVANTAQVAAGPGFAGTHPVGSTLTVQASESTVFLPIRDVGSAEVLVFVREF
jgi:glycosidase